MATAGSVAVATCMLALPATGADAPNAGEATLDELVVTAQRREQRLQDVAGSLAVLSPQEVQERNIKNMNEYLQGVPSVSFQGASSAGRNKVVIRGVSASGETREERTTGLYFGEAPISSLGERGFSDPKLVDIDRVEVLRGPQGTLYGAGAMGGALRVIPAAPDLNTVEGSISQSAAWTRHGSPTYETTGALSVPLADGKLAVRVVGYNYDVGGFIDNVYPGNAVFGAPATATSNVNDANVTGGRVSVLFQPTDAAKATLSYLKQKSQAGGLTEIQPTLAPGISQVRGGQEGFSDNFEVLNLTASYGFGPVELVSVTTSADKKDREVFDIREFLAPFGLPPVSLRNDTSTDFFAQELRLTSTVKESPLFWVVGAYYSDRTVRPTRRNDWYGSDTGFRTFAGLLTQFTGFPINSTSDIYTYDARFKEKQEALYGDATYTFASGLSVAGGLRAARYEYSRAETQAGLFAGGFQSPAPTQFKETVYLPRLNVSYKPNEDTLYYAQAAKGFRVGRVNLRMPNSCAGDLADIGLTVDTVPGQAKSDTLWSYEGGAKLTFGEGRFTANLAAYYIDWKDIQVQFLGPSCGFEFFSNAGKASNRGFEFETTGRITDNLTVGLSTSYNDIHLDEDAPLQSGSEGKDGDPLPGTPKWTVSVNARYGWEIGENEAYVRGYYTYISSYYGNFARDTRGGDFGTLNLSAGFDMSNVGIQVFADNVTDTRGQPQQLTADTGPFPLGPRFEIIRPRTVGVRLTYTH